MPTLPMRQAPPRSCGRLRTLDKVTLLLEHGAAVNARTRTEATPLIVAVRIGNTAVMRTLIAHGADVQADVGALLAEAHAQSNPEVEQVLRDAGVETRDPERLTAILASGQNMVNAGFTERLVARGAALPEGRYPNSHVQRPAARAMRRRRTGCRSRARFWKGEQIPTARERVGLRP